MSYPLSQIPKGKFLSKAKTNNFKNISKIDFSYTNEENEDIIEKEAQKSNNAISNKVQLNEIKKSSTKSYTSTIPLNLEHTLPKFSTTKAQQNDDKENEQKKPSLEPKTGLLNNNQVSIINPSPNQESQETLSPIKKRHSLFRKTFSLKSIQYGSKNQDTDEFGEEIFNVNEMDIAQKIAKEKNFRQRSYFHKKKGGITENNNTSVSISDTSVCFQGKVKISNIIGELIPKAPLIIDHFGIEKKLNKNKDSIVFFGICKEKGVNDYILNIDIETELIPQESFTKTLFGISYDFNCHKFFIQPIMDKDKKGRLILTKVPLNYCFISKTIIVIGSTIIELSPNKKSLNELTVSVFPKNEKKVQKFFFNSLTHGFVLTIGNKSKCIVKLEDEEPGVYFGVRYDWERKLWEISVKENGVFAKNPKGIWIVIDHKIWIEKEHLYKIGNDVFKMSIL